MAQVLILKLALIILYVSVFVKSALVPVTEIHPPKPYKFGYAIKDKHGEQYRQETGDGQHEVRGSYGFVDEKGIKRQVNYIADKEGFRAEIKTNEPGTAPEDPASVKMASSIELAESAKKDSPSGLEKYLEQVASIYKKIEKEPLFSKGLESVKKDQVAEKQFEKMDVAEAKLALEKLVKERFKSYFGNAALPFLKKDVLNKESLGFGKQLGMRHLIPLPFIGSKGPVGMGKDPLLNEASMFIKLGHLAYAPWMVGQGFGPHIPLKSVMNNKEIRMKHLLKGNAMAPASSKNSLPFIPIF